MQAIEQLLHDAQIKYSSIVPMTPGGGDRQYFRVVQESASLIATVSTNVAENKTFLYFTEQLGHSGIAVPKIITTNEAGEIYLQEDLGTESLLDVVVKNGATEHTLMLYKKVIAQLAAFQAKGHECIDYNFCLAAKKFDYSAAQADIKYGLTYFVDAMKIVYDAEKLQQESDKICNVISTFAPQLLMYRDCQGRNIMVQHDNVFFIDYQGAMQGPPAYDIASLLWQAKAALPLDWKAQLPLLHLQELNRLLAFPIQEAAYMASYQLLVFLRLIQVLGAYGRRGLLEGKVHFIESIPYAIDNISQWMTLSKMQQQLPEWSSLLEKIILLRNQF